METFINKDFLSVIKMLTKQEFQEITSRYPLDSVGYIRKTYLKKIIPVLDRKEVLILKGIRRCGKTTLMKQIIQHLFDKGVKKEQVLYVNFDDYNFLPYLNLKLLDFILSQTKTKTKIYLFLDEIQKIPNFESWIRTQYERESKIKFIISGSTSKILSKELGTLLTGRNLSFKIFPFDYSEFKEITNRSLNEFITYGGFPEIVLETNIENKLNLLRNYVSDIVNKDIFEKNKIKDQKQFIYFAQFLFKNPGARVSINKLSKELQISKDTVKKYLQYMIDSYLIFEVPFFSHSAKSKFIASNIPKYYPLDNGFYLVNSARKEIGKQTETIIAQKLFRERSDLFYWKGKNEVDFIAEDNAYNVISSENIPKREILGLNEIREKFKYIKSLNILNNFKEKETENIKYTLIKDFLLNK